MNADRRILPRGKQEVKLGASARRDWKGGSCFGLDWPKKAAWG